MRYRSLRTLAALVCCMAFVSGCSTNTSAPPTWPSFTPSKPLDELPVGAELLTLEQFEAQIPPAVTTRVPWGSIRPDNQPTSRRVPNIVERGRVIVGVGQYLNRLSFRDPLSGKLEGFEIDFAHEIARDIFGDPNRVEFRYVENRRRQASLLNGDVDMVLRTWTISSERQLTTEFSLPYLGISSKLLVLRDSGITTLSDLKGKTVCATKDSAPTQIINNQKVGRLLLTRTWTDCLMAMQRNQADAIYSDDAILSGLQAQDPYTVLLDTGSTISYYGVGMPAPSTGRDAQGLVMQVNQTIERITSDGTWNRLYGEWMQDYLGSARGLPFRYRTPAEDASLTRTRQEWAENNTLPAAGKNVGTLTKEQPHD